MGVEAFSQVDSYGEAGPEGPSHTPGGGKGGREPLFEKDTLQSTLTYTPDAICQLLIKANMLRTEQTGSTSAQIKKTEHDQRPQKPPPASFLSLPHQGNPLLTSHSIDQLCLLLHII